MLQHKRIAVLEFEYHRVGAWAKTAAEPRTLKSTLERLHWFGYKYYFQTFSSLFPASGPCWRDAFSFRDWSNLVCAHEPEAVALLDRAAMHGWRQRERKCTTTASPYLPQAVVGAGAGRDSQMGLDNAALIATFIAGNASRKQMMQWNQHCPRAPRPYNPYDFTQLVGIYYEFRE